MPGSKRVRIAPTETQLAELKDLFADVPSQKVVQYDWTSEAGRNFIKAVRQLQVVGSVPLPWIAEALEVTSAALGGAVGYWERASATRGHTPRRKRETRPLRKEPAGE